MNKPGWQTTEFWLSVLPSVWAAIESGLPPIVRVAVPLISGAIYSAGRALVKASANKSAAAAASTAAVGRMTTGI